MAFLKANGFPVTASLDRPVELTFDGRKQSVRSIYFRRGVVVEVPEDVLEHGMVKDFLTTGALVVRTKLTPDEARALEAEARPAAKLSSKPAAESKSGSGKGSGEGRSGHSGGGSATGASASGAASEAKDPAASATV